MTPSPPAPPFVYQSGIALGLLYAVDVAEAGRLTAPLGVEPLTVAGHALAVVAGFDYHASSLGPFREVALTVVARRQDGRGSALRALLAPVSDPDSGFAVLTMPVSSAVAADAGQRHWGFPKYVTPIDADMTPGRLRLVVTGDIEMTYEAGLAVAMPAQPLVTLTRRGDTLVRTVSSVAHRVRLGRGSRGRVRLLGPGPAARVVEALGIHHRRPLVGFWTRALRVTLPDGTPLP